MVRVRAKQIERNTMIYLTTVWDMYLLLFIQRGSDTIESIVCMQTMRDSCIRKYNLYMNMNGTEMLLLVLHVHQNPIIYWIVFKSNQVEYWRAARRDNTQQQKFEQTTICTFFIYIYFFYIFFSNRNTIPNDFFFFLLLFIKK